MSKILRFAAPAAVALAALAVVLPTNPADAAPSPPVQGEVRRVDQAGGRVTLKHGPIAELELPAMTLVYQVRDKTLLAPLNPGDAVVFTADRIDGQYVVLTIRR